MLVNIALQSQATVFPKVQPKTNLEHCRIGLVCMPWGPVALPSMALALLNTYARSSGWGADVHYLNMRLAARMGLDLYNKISDNGYVCMEWFFSQALFGPDGTQEIDNAWSQLQKTPAGRSFLHQITKLSGMSDETCLQFVKTEVPAFFTECLGATDWSQYSAVGFTSTFAQSLSSLWLAKELKARYPHISIIFGGANVEAEMGLEMIKAFDWIDYVVHGEAEVSFPALLNAIRLGQIEPIPGVSIRLGERVIRGDENASPTMDMDSIPKPDYSEYVAQLEQTGLKKGAFKVLHFESSRGCWWGVKHHCTFCALNRGGMVYRKKSPEKVYQEIAELVRDYSCSCLFATDNILAPQYFSDLLPRLAQSKLGVQFFYEVKANIKREQLELMVAAGVTTIQPGIESFSTRLLALMDKGVTAIQNVQLLKWCTELDVDTHYNILFGFPQESPEDYSNLAEVFLMLSHLQPTRLCPVMFERFSPYYFNRDRFKLKLKAHPYYQFVFPGPRVNYERIAYYFDGEWEGQQCDPGEYLKPARESLRTWRKNYGHIDCSYSKEPDGILVRDNRPRTPGGRPKPRGYRLRGKLAAIVVFCEEHRSLRSILAMMSELFGGDAPESMVREWLDTLVSRWLLFKDGDQYLTLAVNRTRSQPVE